MPLRCARVVAFQPRQILQMPRIAWIACLAWLVPCAGCGTPWLSVRQQNPIFVPVGDPEFVWSALVDVTDDHFRIEREERVKVVNNLLTIGRIETYWEPSSTLAEPWRSDTVSLYDKLESTLQSYRRRADIVVVPVEGGYNVQLQVFKDLEDVPKPLYATAGAAYLRNETTQRHVKMAIGQQPTVSGWIPKGRDTNLEQKMINQLLVRLGVRPPWWLRGPLPYATN